jgi:adenine-specific DNA-methyltransferase
MPTLHWIGKDKVVSHHQEVPYRVLEHKYGFTAPSASTEQASEQSEPTHSGNKIIHGDNLEALKSLLPEYEGKIKCIYIDPPYNTGNEKWVYNDNVNHPKIKKWLGEVVGKDGEDLSRHDKWLCMMYPRLKLLHKLLADDGAIFISIDDNEYQNLVLVMNEIFGVRNKIATTIWDLGTGTQAGHFTRAHEYILVYAKTKSQLKNFSGGEGMIDDRAVKKIGVKNPESEFTFPKGTKWEADNGLTLSGEWGGTEKVTLVKGNMKCENGVLIEDVTLKAGWTQKSQMESFFAGEDTYDTKGQKVVEFYFRANGKIYCRKKRSIVNPPTVLRKIATTKTGSSEVKALLGSDRFNFPKPSELIKFIVTVSTDKNSIILDSFAGSGTTAHAVLNLNKQDGGNRKFILIEMEDYANTITAERVKRVAKGYGASTSSTSNKKVEGTGGAFDFYELGLPLFDENQNLNEAVGLPKIREYIWFSETRTSFTEPNAENYFLGKKDESAYYFIYEKDRLTTLDYDALELIKTKGEQYIIYADNCLLPKDFMAKKNIMFKKIPRDITRF